MEDTDRTKGHNSPITRKTTDKRGGMTEPRGDAFAGPAHTRSSFGTPTPPAHVGTRETPRTVEPRFEPRVPPVGVKPRMTARFDDTDRPR